MVLAFLLLTLTEGAAAFVLTYGYTAEQIRPGFPLTFPFWFTFNSTLGMSLLTLVADLIFPMSLFISLYAIGDKIPLEGNIIGLSLSIALGGVIGYALGYAIGTLAFLPAFYNPLSVLEAEIGIAEVVLRGFFAFVIGFSAVIIRQLRTKAIWIT